MRNCMLDTETLGLRPGYAILSLGAVEFELDGQTGDHFYANIDPKSCIEAGLKRNPQTMDWWARQSEAAQNVLIHSRRPLAQVLHDFVDWWKERKLAYVWSQGAAFDVPIVEAAMDAVGIEPPWKFWNVRDTRTVYALAELDTRDVIRPTSLVAHNAADDARHQIACVAAAMRMLKGGTAKAGVEALF